MADVSNHCLAAVAAIEGAAWELIAHTGAALTFSASDELDRDMIRALELVENYARVVTSAAAVVSRERAALQARQPLRLQLRASVDALGSR